MPQDKSIPLVRVINEIGVERVAKACGVSQQAVYKWLWAGALPRTEWTGETAHALDIMSLAKGDKIATSVDEIRQRRGNPAIQEAVSRGHGRRRSRQSGAVS